MSHSITSDRKHVVLMPVGDGNLKARNLKVPNLRYRRDFAAGNHLRRGRDGRVIWSSARPNLPSLRPTSFGECWNHTWRTRNWI